jgi:hypothetical protein
MVNAEKRKFAPDSAGDAWYSKVGSRRGSYRSQLGWRPRCYDPPGATTFDVVELEFG